ncbi:MAG: hypothetical protein CMF61_03570 [Magnetococcales bacterium]|nr:hypothetical protein [Magnetococcales bacterium]
MVSRQKQKMGIFATILALAGCQGAYNSHTGAPQPVLDQRVAQETPLKMETISQGGIIMKRTYDPSWEMPKRDVDVIREQLSKLQGEFIQLHTGQEQKMLSKFQEVEQRVAQMRREEMRKAAQDAELMALVKSKFDTIDKNISFLKASEAQQISEKDALLAVLDDKFVAVEDRLEQLNKKDDFQNKAHQQEIRMALEELSKIKAEKDVLIRALDKKFNEVENFTEVLSEGLKSVEYEQDVQNRLAVARKQAMEEAREMRLLEELEMRKSLEQDRREQLSLVMQQAEREKLAGERANIERAKRQAELEFKIASLKKELDIIEMQEARRMSEADVRAQAMKESLEVRLASVKDVYDMKFKQLEKEKAELNNKLASLNEKSVQEIQKNRSLLEDKIEKLNATQEKSAEDSKVYKEKLANLEDDKNALEEKLAEVDVTTITALEEQKESLQKTIEELKQQQDIAMEEAASYRDAIEQRIFAMESQKGKPVKQESIDSEDLKLGRVIETTARTSNIEMTAADKGGVLGGYPQEDWIDLEDYQVVMHINNDKLEDIMDELLTRAQPYVGDWDVKWKLKPEHMDVLDERFSLDVETDFDAFTSYLSNYMKSYRGFGLTFNIFRKERILVVTD